MGNTLAAIVIGAFILMAAAVIVNPDLAAGAWEFGATVLKWIAICVTVIIVGCIALLALACAANR